MKSAGLRADDLPQPVVRQCVTASLTSWTGARFVARLLVAFIPGAGWQGPERGFEVRAKMLGWNPMDSSVVLSLPAHFQTSPNISR